MCFKGRQESRKKKSVIKKQQKERGMIETTRWDYLKHLQLPRSVRKLETAPMGHTKISFIFFFLVWRCIWQVYNTVHLLTAQYYMVKLI